MKRLDRLRTGELGACPPSRVTALESIAQNAAWLLACGAHLADVDHKTRLGQQIVSLVVDARKQLEASCEALGLLDTYRGDDGRLTTPALAASTTRRLAEYVRPARPRRYLDATRQAATVGHPRSVNEHRDEHDSAKGRTSPGGEQAVAPAAIDTRAAAGFVLHGSTFRAVRFSPG